jgi:hypothetical protein
MSERDDGIAYNQTSGGLPVLKKILCTSLLMFCFLYYCARADAL